LSRLLLLLLLLLLPLFRAFPDDRRSAGLRNQNRQRQRGNHEDDCRRCRGSLQDRTGAASAECGLTSAATKSSGPVGALALLQQHDKNQEDANNNVKNR